MAIILVRLGSVVNAYAYDDVAFDSAFESTAPIKAGSPIDPNDVVILGAASPGAVTPVSVANIDDPSAELNALAGVLGSLVLAYEVEAASDQYTLYAFDASDAGGEDVPYSVDASGSGLWIAIGGKYFNAGFLVKGSIVISDGGTIGSVTTPAAITIEADGDLLLSDRIGIGITPAYEIHIQDAAAPTILLDDTTNNCVTFFQAGDTIGRIGTVSNHEFRIQTNSSDRIGITNGGVTNIGDAGVANYVSIEADGDTVFVGGAGLCYGSMYLHDAAVNVDISAVGQGTPVKVTGLLAGLTHNVTINADAFNVDYIGVYKVDWQMSGDSQGNNITYDFHIYVNGVEQDGGSGHREFGGVGSLGSISGTGLIDVTDTGHDIDIRITEPGGGAGTDFDIDDLNFNITQIGGT